MLVTYEFLLYCVTANIGNSMGGGRFEAKRKGHVRQDESLVEKQKKISPSGKMSNFIVKAENVKICNIENTRTQEILQVRSTFFYFHFKQYAIRSLVLFGIFRNALWLALSLVLFCQPEENFICIFILADNQI